MDTTYLLAVFPFIIAVGNVVTLLLLAWREKDKRKKVFWLVAILVLTVIIWGGAAIAYSFGLADSAASCLNQVDYPGCQGFREMTTLFDRTLGNFSYLALLCGFDLLVIWAGSYLLGHFEG